ncbi:MipA/OmpV family protein [Chitinilyticum litopenaei]|uniref:MipA/OmpV family protein n=1 Tax=Chitinilyticum litopenaei TaxID=1121276 RepID=UPI00048DA073|nr:MipA/OmpV family protein [Chitinilyticum litopenaei]
MRTTLLSPLLLLALSGHGLAAETLTSTEWWKDTIRLDALGQLWDETTDGKNWQVSTAVGAVVGPNYSGGGKLEFGPLVDVTVVHKSGFTLGSGRGIGYLRQLDDWELFANISASGSREEKDGKDGDKNRLQGMGKISSGAQFGLSVAHEFGPVGMELAWTTGLAEKNRGNTLILSASLPVYQSEMLQLSVNGNLVGGDSKYLQRWYGVDALQSQNSGHRQYRPGAGLHEGSVGLALAMPVGKQLNWITAVNYTQLLGDAADSPLVEKKGSVSASSGLQYQW